MKTNVIILLAAWLTGCTYVYVMTEEVTIQVDTRLGSPVSEEVKR